MKPKTYTSLPALIRAAGNPALAAALERRINRKRIDWDCVFWTTLQTIVVVGTLALVAVVLTR